MATDLTISITDAEEAYVINAVDFLGLTMTPAELKTWLESRAKDLLRADVKQRVDFKIAEDSMALHAQKEAEAESAWPDPNAPSTEEPDPPEVPTPPETN